MAPVGVPLPLARADWWLEAEECGGGGHRQSGNPGNGDDGVKKGPCGVGLARRLFDPRDPSVQSRGLTGSHACGLDAGRPSRSD